MKNKFLLPIGAAVVIACVVLAYLVFKSGDPATPADTATSDAPARPSGGNFGNAGNPADSPAARPPRSSSRNGGAWARLAEKFGESRTGLSKKVTDDLAVVLEDSLKLADMGAKLAGAQGMVEATTRPTVDLLGRQLELSDEQKEQATAIVSKAVEARFQAVEELTAAMKSDPEPVMELFLYGDAVARGEMTQEEYETATAGTRGMLQDVSGYVMGRGPNTAMPLLGDENFNNDLAAILTPAQREELATLNANPPEAPPRRGPANLPFQNGEVPVMELEKLDQAISSARTMTGGLQQVFQGLEGLQQNDEP